MSLDDSRNAVTSSSLMASPSVNAGRRPPYRTGRATSPGFIETASAVIATAAASAAVLANSFIAGTTRLRGQSTTRSWSQIRKQSEQDARDRREQQGHEAVAVVDAVAPRRGRAGTKVALRPFSFSSSNLRFSLHLDDLFLGPRIERRVAADLCDRVVEALRLDDVARPRPPPSACHSSSNSRCASSTAVSLRRIGRRLRSSIRLSSPTARRAVGVEGHVVEADVRVQHPAAELEAGCRSRRGQRRR